MTELQSETSSEMVWPEDPQELSAAILERVETMSPDERLTEIRDFRMRNIQGERFGPADTRFALALIRSTRADAKPKSKKTPPKELSLDELFS